MDGVTDAPFRQIQAEIGHPAVVFTEFTAVEGLRAGATRLLNDFLFSEQERPVVAQLFGSDPDAFFIGAVIASALGFDGIDINMGCPAKNVIQRGAGAGLILDPKRAAQIIHQTKQGTSAWAEGISLSDAGVPETIQAAMAIGSRRMALPISVKTRTGYGEPIINEWIPFLLEQQPAAITLHGRTLKQGYSGVADWQAIGAAARLTRASQTIFLGNGDVNSLSDAFDKIKEYATDGVLVGRATMGNPWFFLERDAPSKERLETARRHAQLHLACFGEPGFVRIRKHLLDYTKGVDNSKELRGRLARVSNLDQIEELLSEHDTVTA